MSALAPASVSVPPSRPPAPPDLPPSRPPAPPDLPPFPDTALALDTPDGPASCALWWTHGLTWDRAPAGAIGRLDAPTTEALGALLAAACDRLAAAGCRLALGPLDGTTWDAYRLVTDPGTAPPFLLDIDTPPHWAPAFAAAGFDPVANYVSAEAPIGPPTGMPVPGVAVRALAADRWAHDVPRLVPLVQRAFAASPGFVPLPDAAVAARLARLVPLVAAGCSVVAERTEPPTGHASRDAAFVGVLLAYPDPASGALVHKTLAVDPGAQRRGLGRWMADAAEARAQALGMHRVIHALMRDGNASQRLSGHRAATVRRRYALLGRVLPPSGAPLRSISGATAAPLAP